MTDDKPKRGRKAAAQPALATVPEGERKLRRWRPPEPLPAFTPMLGHRPKQPKRRPVLHPFRG